MLATASELLATDADELSGTNASAIVMATANWNKAAEHAARRGAVRPPAARVGGHRPRC